MSKMSDLDMQKKEEAYYLIESLREEARELKLEIEEAKRQVKLLENKLKEKDAELNKIYEGGSWIV